MVVNTEILNDVKKLTGVTKFRHATDLVSQRKVVIAKCNYSDDFTFDFKAKVMDGDEIFNTEIEVDDGNFITRKCSCQAYQDNVTYCTHVSASILELNRHSEYEDMNNNDDEETNAGGIQKLSSLVSSNNALNDNDSDDENNNDDDEEKDYSYGSIKKVSRDMKYKDSMQLLKLFAPDSNLAQRKKDKSLIGEVKIIPKLEYDMHQNQFSCEFSVGTNVFYKIKDIERFYECMISNENFEYGKSLRFIHTMDKFDDRSKKLALLIMEYGRMLHILNRNSDLTYRYGAIHKDNIELSGSLLDDFFDIMLGESVDVSGVRGTNDLLLSDEKPLIRFKIEKNNKEEYKLKGSFSNFNKVISGEHYTYFINEGVIHRCNTKTYKDLFKVTTVLGETPSKEVTFDKASMPQLFSLVIPRIKENFDFNSVTGTELEEYMPAPLSVKMYLDTNKSNDIEAKIKFAYNDKEFDPLNPDEGKDVTRSFNDEEEVYDFLSETGFVRSDKGTIILHREEDIYKFLTEEIMEYMKRFEVLASEDFNKKQIVKSKISSAKVRMDNNLLELEFDNLGYSLSELKQILDGYNEKKKFVRLKSGEFLSLEENEELEFVADLARGGEVDVNDLATGKVALPAYRGIYLERLLDKLKNTNVVRDKNYKSVIDKFKEPEKFETKLPKNLENVLRVYQKDGYRWLNVLDDYNFGGILADDMGLGKTIQVISLVQNYVDKVKDDEHKASLVVCPSSLLLNWKSEFEKFAPKVNVLVLRGMQDERKNIFKQIKKYDIVITSYDLLKRDIEEYEKLDYTFKYVIADEAQYIKNSQTKNSQALKKIKAETRYALTGTPIENALSELWSIFDFIMPGYLYNYSKFKKIYELPIIKEENYYARESLKKQIEPFILRRLKKDVLTELPDKTITILKNEMDEEQRKVYVSYLAKAKEELMTEIDAHGLENSKIKILALLTRLRQICCHPSLFLENYKGESSKFNQSMEIIEESIESGHKILLFSQYTSMFEFFEKALEEKGIKYFKLIGSTKIDERIRMVDEFNNNDDIKVFLISLKAGGTGLNLTGADVVMHYDPWWNLSAENQATDRAYRIGQKNNVQVYKFITDNSIEEKINEMQERKAKLSEDILSTEESFISKMTKEDIMKLFED